MLDERPLFKDREVVRKEIEELGPDYVLYDQSNPRALINLVPNSLREVMNTLDDRYRYMTESELKRKCDAEVREARLRISFWIEYNAAQKTGRMMNIANVVRGNTSMDYWENVVLKDSAKVAFIITPPKDYLVAMHELLDLGLEKLREIIKAPLFDKRGAFDSKAADKVIKAVHTIESRLKGAVVQKTVNLNADVNAGEIGVDPVNINTANLEELEAQVARVRAKLDRAEDRNEREVVGVIEGELVGTTQGLKEQTSNDT